MGKHYFRAQMHLHSCYEETASMEGHCYMAKKLGLDVIFMTDHDTYMGGKVRNNGCNFEQGLSYGIYSPSRGETPLDDWYDYCEGLGMSKQVLHWRKEKEDGHLPRTVAHWDMTREPSNAAAVMTTDTSDPFVGTQSMKLQLSSQDGSDAVLRTVFVAGNKGYNRSLFANVCVAIALKCSPDFAEDSELQVEFKLSQHPENFKIAHITYSSKAEKKVCGTDAVIPLRLIGDNQWHVYMLPLSADSEYAVAGGLDNALNMMTLIVKTRSTHMQTIWVGNLTIWDQYRLNELRERTIPYLTKTGEKYGITAYCATEISESGHHMIAFSDGVPIINYPAHPDYYVSEEEAVNHVRKYGGHYSYNHPFSRFKKVTLTSDERKMAKEYEINKLVQTRANGADFIEVGFPEGRYGFTGDDFLELWDALSSAGVYITGYGDSDAHWNDRRWLDGNNFGTCIGAESISRSDLLAGMLSGDCYGVDPAQFTGTLSFAAANSIANMGDVVTGAKQGDTFRLVLTLTGCKPGWKLQWTDNGITGEETAASDGSFTHMYTYHGGNGFSRAVVRNGTGRMVLFTNPIYFTERSDGRGN